MKRLELAGVLVTVVLAACIPIKGDVDAGSKSTIVETGAPLRSGEAIAILGAKPRDEGIASCVRDAVAKAAPTTPIVPPEKFQLTSDNGSGSANTALPHQETGNPLRGPTAMRAISDLTIRYVLTIEGSTEEKDYRSAQGNNFPAALLAVSSSHKSTSIRVLIWDAATAKKLGLVQTFATGQPSTVFIVAVGFWNYAPTESTACEETAKQLLRFLAGEIHPGDYKGLDPEEAAVPGRLSVASTLKSKSLDSRNCVHPSDLETYLRIYAPAVERHLVSVGRTPPIYRPPGFTIVMQYEFPKLSSPVSLTRRDAVVRPGDSLQACGFSQSDAETPSDEVVENTCMQIFQTRNPNNEQVMFWPIETPQANAGGSPFLGTCHIWLHDYK